MFRLTVIKWRCVCVPYQVEHESQAITFELEEIKNGPNVEPYLVELLHQASYRGNTLGLPSIYSEEDEDKITAEELKIFLAAHYTPSRMVLTGVNVDHQQLLDLANQHFVGAKTSWEGVESRRVDQSIAQYTSYEKGVNPMRNACTEGRGWS